MSAACLEAARTALSRLRCPHDDGFLEQRAAIVAQHLAEDADGVVRVVDAQGNPRYSAIPAIHGQPVPVEYLIEELVSHLRHGRPTAGFRSAHAMLPWSAAPVQAVNVL